MRLRLHYFACLFLTCASGPAQNLKPGFTLIQAPELANGSAVSLSEVNTVVGWFNDAHPGTHAFLLSRDDRIAIFDIPDAQTFPAAVNDAGTVAGAYVSANEPARKHGFIRTAEGALTLFDGPPPAATLTVRALNNRGVVIGSYGNADRNVHGFLRATDGAFTPIDVPHETIANPTAINDDGVVTGHYQNTPLSAKHGFIRRQDGAMVLFDAGDSTEPRGINARGTVVGSYIDDANAQHAFIRTTDGAIVAFDFPEADATVATAVSDAGAITGYAAKNGYVLGFIRTADGAFVNFHGAAGSRVEPVAINNSGEVACTFTSSSGVARPCRMALTSAANPD